VRRPPHVSQFVLKTLSTPNPNRLPALVNDMIEHFGGLDQFSAALKGQIDRVRESSPMGNKTLDFFRAVTRQAEVAEQRAPETQELSDNELADQLLASTERLVAEHPERVLQVAEALGWTVHPPAGGLGGK
jgi:hypothetical protein